MEYSVELSRTELRKVICSFIPSSPKGRCPSASPACPPMLIASQLNDVFCMACEAGKDRLARRGWPSLIWSGDRGGSGRGGRLNIRVVKRLADKRRSGV